MLLQCKLFCLPVNVKVLAGVDLCCTVTFSSFHPRTVMQHSHALWLNSGFQEIACRAMAQAAIAINTTLGMFV